MNNNLDIELILQRQKYPTIYNTPILILIIIASLLYILFIYKYQSYMLLEGTVKNNSLEILINIDELKYLKNNHTLTIDNKEYNYKILYLDNKCLNNKKYVYIYVENLDYLENYIYELKLEKENKILAKYLQEYLKGD